MTVRRLFLALASLGLLLGALFPAAALSPVSYAAAPPDSGESKNKGLYISPLRSYLELNSDQSVTRAFTVANLTEQPMTVTSHIEQFSVADYSYDYKFDEPDNNWVQLVENVVTLKPYESHEMAYRVNIPKNAAPGGHYYTLYASSNLQTGGTKSTVQAATLLYLTVNGNLKRTSQVVNRSLPGIVITPDIKYSLDIKNTGNIHYFAYIAERVDGLGYHDTPNGTSQLLMPGTTRRAEGSIKSPVLPGVYKLSYTITPDQGDKTEGSQYFLFLPPWSIALLIIIAAVIGHFVVRRLGRKKARTP